MAAAYDSYNYPSYWEKRVYEHESELIAIKSFLSSINKIDKTLMIGVGFGRLIPVYLHRTKKITAIDPSAKLLMAARKKHKDKKIEYIQSTVENLSSKINKKYDLITLIRVLHHLNDIDKVFGIVSDLLKPGGYFILEYANKRHIKAVVKSIFRGDFTFVLDIFPKDIRSLKFVKRKTLPFVNYHPDTIERKLKKAGLSVIATRSVSNFRSVRVKGLLSVDILLWLEKRLQVPFAEFHLGPSIFILARKT